MRETIRSMRAYFGLIGILGAIGVLTSMDLFGSALGTVIWMINLGVVAATLYLATRFEFLLLKKTRQVLGIILVTGGISVLGGVADVLLVPATGQVVGLALAIKVGIPALITWYLFTNARRLAWEYGSDPAVANAFD